jgi:hypothetical protein
MANRTATLYLRITAKGGRKSYCKPVYLSKARLKPQFAVVNDEAEHHPEGVYYLRCGVDGGKQQFVLIVRDSFVALDKCRKAALAPGPGTAARSPETCQLQTRKRSDQH